jgi:hypothetical protein
MSGVVCGDIRIGRRTTRLTSADNRPIQSRKLGALTYRNADR